MKLIGQMLINLTQFEINSGKMLSWFLVIIMLVFTFSNIEALARGDRLQRVDCRPETVDGRLETVDCRLQIHCQNPESGTRCPEPRTQFPDPGTQNPVPSNINTNPFQYSGYYLDAPSGLYYLNARYYSPELRRFISRDSYDLSNHYAYCDGSPVFNTDPNGHIPEWIGAVAGMGITTVAGFGLGLFLPGINGAVAAIISGTIIGGLSSAAGNTVDQLISTGRINSVNLALATTGGIASGVFYSAIGVGTKLFYGETRFLSELNNAKNIVEDNITASGSALRPKWSGLVEPERAGIYNKTSYVDTAYKHAGYEIELMEAKQYSLEMRIDLMKKYQIGNCDDQSLYVAKLLKDKGIKVQTESSAALKHVYAVAQSPITKIKYVVDPWRGIPVMRYSQLKTQFGAVGTASVEPILETGFGCQSDFDWGYSILFLNNS